jgi:hypothetical protein
MKFRLGQIVATPGALKTLLPHEVVDVLRRHARLEQGALDNEDHSTNQRAVECGGRVFSAFEVRDTRVWVITESDRSSTCVLLPEEY